MSPIQLLLMIPGSTSQPQRDAVSHRALSTITTCLPRRTFTRISFNEATLVRSNLGGQCAAVAIERAVLGTCHVLSRRQLCLVTLLR